MFSLNWCYRWTQASGTFLWNVWQLVICTWALKNSHIAWRRISNSVRERSALRVAVRLAALSPEYLKGRGRVAAWNLSQMPGREKLALSKRVPVQWGRFLLSRSYLKEDFLFFFLHFKKLWIFLRSGCNHKQAGLGEVTRTTRGSPEMNYFALPMWLFHDLNRLMFI